MVYIENKETRTDFHAPLAQLGERLLDVEKVVGSSPTRSTISPSRQIDFIDKRLVLRF